MTKENKMRIEQQEPVFSPIAIILETKDEAEIFWDVAERIAAEGATKQELRNFMIKVSNAFTSRIKL